MQSDRFACCGSPRPASEPERAFALPTQVHGMHDRVIPGLSKKPREGDSAGDLREAGAAD
jgi:hypothetical protein